MRPIRYRAALLLTGALLPLAGCGHPAAPDAKAAPQVVRARAEEAQREEKPAGEEKKESGDGFRFPDDKGGRLLAKELPPRERGPGSEGDVTTTPRRLPGSPALEHPAVPLPPNQGQVPRLPSQRQGPPLRPRSLSDDLPPGGARLDPPREPRFDAGERVRLPGPDVTRPVALPILATPAPDRAALEDPTADLSSAAAQSATVPARAAPAPFTKVSLPDPFENRAARLRETPPEREDPVTAAPKGPGK
ncbi:MAG TPA: hypothetical protein VFW33_09170 [Gemmataceae bacterium]|nr:hypothetical protein [Gemmataceae bacterium]